jgi:hypothetical protein
MSPILQYRDHNFYTWSQYTIGLPIVLCPPEISLYRPEDEFCDDVSNDKLALQPMPVSGMSESLRCNFCSSPTLSKLLAAISMSYYQRIKYRGKKAVCGGVSYHRDMGV